MRAENVHTDEDRALSPSLDHAREGGGPRPGAPQTTTTMTETQPAAREGTPATSLKSLTKSLV